MSEWLEETSQEWRLRVVVAQPPYGDLGGLEFAIEKEDFSVRSRCSRLLHPLFSMQNGYATPMVYRHWQLLRGAEASEEEKLDAMRTTLENALCGPSEDAPLLWGYEGLPEMYIGAAESVTRANEVIQRYAELRLHPELFVATFQPHWIHPELLDALQGKVELERVVVEVSPGIYAFPMFTDAFCTMLLEELTHYNASGLPAQRPNTMNHNGLILNQLGLAPLADSLMRTYVQPLARYLFPSEGSCLDTQHTFTVQYRM